MCQETFQSNNNNNNNELNQNTVENVRLLNRFAVV